MTGYLIRRFFQMVLVVLIATMAIYAILNLAPGGPLSGLNQTADRKQRFTPADIERLKVYLGLDKPLVLRYVVWLLGDDWLGATHMSLALKPPEGERFYAEPSIAYARGGRTLWIVGEPTDRVSKEGLVIWRVSKVHISGRGTMPKEYTLSGAVIKVENRTIRMDVDRQDADIVLEATPETVWEVEGLSPRPEGAWLPVGWLFGSYGLLGDYAHFHGTGHGVARMDWGRSWAVARGQPIVDLFKSRLGNTLLLLVTATVISLVVAIPIGVISAVKQYSVLDYIVTTFTFIGTSLPSFWFGLMMVLIFSIKFKEWGIPYMPAGGIVSLRAAPAGSLIAALKIAPGSLADKLVHMIMPTFVLSMLSMAGWSRFMRSQMLEVLRQDYVRTARAKGLAERVVIVKHAMRNALIPLVTIVVLAIPGFFSGAIITESIFSWQGMGRLYFNALSADDWPVVMVFLYVQSILVVLATLLGDILYTIVDPRIRYD